MLALIEETKIIALVIKNQYIYLINLVMEAVMEESSLNLARGFLPTQDPCKLLPDEFAVWEALAAELPKLLVAGQVRKQIDAMPLLPVDGLRSTTQLERAMLLLSFLGHAYVFGVNQPVTQIPAPLAIPWHRVATKLDRPPVLSYASYALHNWRRIDSKGPIALGNIVLLQNFLGGIDEEWFVLIHVEIEHKAATGLRNCLPMLEAIAHNEIDKAQTSMEQIALALADMCQTLDRMTEHCDPYIYYNRVRPYIHGWKDNPALPNGLIYEGVTEFQHQPQQYRGETGAQSSIVPSFDALLGVEHENDPLRVYLNEMRTYMPYQHRKFIESIERQGSVRAFIQDHYPQHPQLREFYNSSLESLSQFRQTHLRFAAQYIQKQSQTSAANPTAVGTGGTPFMSYLRKHQDETMKFII